MHGAGKEIHNRQVPIPYRVMLPRPVSNLICPGRAVSAEREVLGPLRVMAPCMAMGQAAGTAATLAMKMKEPVFSKVCPSDLRAALAARGAII
jgi:hypothetical protein